MKFYKRFNSESEVRVDIIDLLGEEIYRGLLSDVYKILKENMVDNTSYAESLLYANLNEKVKSSLPDDFGEDVKTYYTIMILSTMCKYSFTILEELKRSKNLSIREDINV